MSRFTDAAAAMHTLSLAAMEEASRLGLRDADIDHLLLALTIDADTGGQVLRRAGVRLDATRAAVEAQHAGQLLAMGIDAPAVGPGRIVFHETDGYDWTERALAVLRAASQGGRRGDSAAVLRALLAEPSGLITAILGRLAVTEDDLTAQLDEVEGTARSPQPGRKPVAGGITGSRSMFVPAAESELRAVLADPERLPEWEQSVAGVLPAGNDGPWEAFAPTTAPDGRPLRRKPEFHRLRVMREEESGALTWRFEYPDAPHANPRALTMALEPAAGGTQLRATMTWEARPRGPVRRALRAPLLPLWRGLVFIQLAQVESGISRLFR